MTLDEIRANVLADLGDPDGDIWTNEDGNPRLDRLIDRAYEKLINAAIAVDAQFLQTSTTEGLTSLAGGNAVQNLALPANFRRAIVLERTLPLPVRPVPIVSREIFNLYRGIDDGQVAYLQHEVADTTNGDQDTSATLNLYLATSTTYSYELFYSKRPTRLVQNPLAESDSTAIELPAEFHYLIVLGAVIMALLQENGEAGGFKALYDEGLREMLPTFNRSPGQAAMVG